jgi:hypothetical protein
MTLSQPLLHRVIGLIGKLRNVHLWSTADRPRYLHGIYIRPYVGTGIRARRLSEPLDHKLQVASAAARRQKAAVLWRLGQSDLNTVCIAVLYNQGLFIVFLILAAPACTNG